MEQTYSFSEITVFILHGNLDLLFRFRDNLYWITVKGRNGLTMFARDKDSIRGHLILEFPTAQEFLDSVLIDNMKLSGMWNEIEVLSLDGGVLKNENKTNNNTTKNLGG
jgi:hypothetical protein